VVTDTLQALYASRQRLDVQGVLAVHRCSPHHQ
jgi:hypothetical protein